MKIILCFFLLLTFSIGLAYAEAEDLKSNPQLNKVESEAKKKPTAANAPTLQQHPISPKAALPSTVIAPSAPAPAEGAGSNAESNSPY